MIVEFKSAVTVSEMARMLGLSRARFYQLIGTAFPHPVYSVSTRRPLFVEELQKVCLEVRRKNCGIDGKPILFYSRRPGVSSLKKQIGSPRTKKLPAKYSNIINGLKGLGMSGVTDQQVETAIQKLYPHGTVGVDEATLIRTIFVALMRQNR